MAQTAEQPKMQPADTNGDYDIDDDTDALLYKHSVAMAVKGAWFWTLCSSVILLTEIIVDKSTWLLRICTIASFLATSLIAHIIASAVLKDYAAFRKKYNQKGYIVENLIVHGTGFFFYSIVVVSQMFDVHGKLGTYTGALLVLLFMLLYGCVGSVGWVATKWGLAFIYLSYIGLLIGWCIQHENRNYYVMFIVEITVLYSAVLAIILMYTKHNHDSLYEAFTNRRIVKSSVLRVSALIDAIVPAHFRSKVLAQQPRVSSGNQSTSCVSPINHKVKDDYFVPSFVQDDKIIHQLNLPTPLGFWPTSSEDRHDHIADDKSDTSSNPPVSTSEVVRSSVTNEKKMSRRVLQSLMILPQPIIEQFADVSLIVIKLFDVDKLQDELGQDKYLVLLNDVYAALDVLVAAMDVIKITNINDYYVVLVGTDGTSNHPLKAMKFTSAIHRLSHLWSLQGLQINALKMPSVTFQTGINSGPLTCGVLGSLTPRYSVFGDMADVAISVCNMSPPGATLVSSSFFNNLSKLVCIRLANRDGAIRPVSPEDILDYEHIVLTESTVCNVVSGTGIDISDLLNWIDQSFRFCSTYINKVSAKAIGGAAIEMAISMLCSPVCDVGTEKALVSARVLHPIVAADVKVNNSRVFLYELFHSPNLDQISFSVSVSNDSSIAAISASSSNILAPSDRKTKAMEDLVPEDFLGERFCMFLKHATSHYMKPCVKRTFTSEERMPKTIWCVPQNNDFLLDGQPAELDTVFSVRDNCWVLSKTVLNYPRFGATSKTMELTHGMLLRPLIPFFIRPEDEMMLRNRGSTLKGLADGENIDPAIPVDNSPRLHPITLRYISNDPEVDANLEVEFMSLLSKNIFITVRNCYILAIFAYAVIFVFYVNQPFSNILGMVAYSLTTVACAISLFSCRPLAQGQYWTFLHVYITSASLYILGRSLILASHIKSKSEGYLEGVEPVEILLPHEILVALILCNVVPQVHVFFSVGFILFQQAAFFISYASYGFSFDISVQRMLYTMPTFLVAIWVSRYFMRLTKEQTFYVSRYNDETMILSDLLSFLLPSQAARSIVNGQVSKAGVSIGTVVRIKVVRWSDPGETVDFCEALHEIFTMVDRLCVKYRMQRMATLNDTCSCVSGVSSVEISEGYHAVCALLLMRDVMIFARELNIKRTKQQLPVLHVRTGVATGMIYSGVVGHTGLVSVPTFLVWGNTAHMAEELSNASVIDGVLVSVETAHAASRASSKVFLDFIAPDGQSSEPSTAVTSLYLRQIYVHGMS